MLSLNLFLILIIISISKVHSSQLVCDFAMHSNRMYTCKGVADFTTDEHDSSIGSVVGNHLAGKTNQDVQQLIIENANVEYFPNSLGIFFPKLESIVIKHSGLEILRSSGFHDLTELKYLNLSANKIEMIGPGVFKENENLEELDFRGNHIKSLSSDILKIGKLRVAKFDNNICIDMTFDIDKKRNGAEFRDIVKSNCSVSTENEIHQLKLELENMKSQLSKSQETIRQQIGVKFSASSTANEDSALSGRISGQEVEQKIAVITTALQQDIERLKSEQIVNELELQATREELEEKGKKVEQLEESLESKISENEQIKLENLAYQNKTIELKSELDETKNSLVESTKKAEILSETLEATKKENVKLTEEKNEQVKIKNAMAKKMTLISAQKEYVDRVMTENKHLFP